MIFLVINFHFQNVDNSALSSGEYYTLPAQTEDIVDLKGGLLSNTVCTVKVPVGEFNISSNKTHTELTCIPVLCLGQNLYIYFLYS